MLRQASSWMFDGFSCSFNNNKNEKLMFREASIGSPMGFVARWIEWNHCEIRSSSETEILRL